MRKYTFCLIGLLLILSGCYDEQTTSRIKEAEVTQEDIRKSIEQLNRQQDEYNKSLDELDKALKELQKNIDEFGEIKLVEEK